MMLRALGFSGFVRFMRTVVVVTVASSIVISCTETTAVREQSGESVSKDILPDGSVAFTYHYPDSIRYGSAGLL